MSRPAALALPARRFVVVCFGFDAACLQSSPGMSPTASPAGSPSSATRWH